MSDQTASSARAMPDAPARLVLVEDDENVRRSMTMLLRARGFKIDAYRSGAEFLMMQGHTDADCLLIDYKMPRLNGLDVMRRLRALNDDTPGIMITGYYSTTLRAQALSAGYNDILEKPARPGSVISAVNTLIAQPH